MGALYASVTKTGNLLLRPPSCCSKLTRILGWRHPSLWHVGIDVRQLREPWASRSASCLWGSRIRSRHRVRSDFHHSADDWSFVLAQRDAVVSRNCANPQDAGPECIPSSVFLRTASVDSPLSPFRAVDLLAGTTIPGQLLMLGTSTRSATRFRRGFTPAECNQVDHSTVVGIGTPAVAGS